VTLIEQTCFGWKICLPEYSYSKMIEFVASLLRVMLSDHVIECVLMVIIIPNQFVHQDSCTLFSIRG